MDSNVDEHGEDDEDEIFEDKPINQSVIKEDEREITYTDGMAESFSGPDRSIMADMAE